MEAVRRKTLDVCAPKKEENKNSKREINQFVECYIPSKWLAFPPCIRFRVFFRRAPSRRKEGEMLIPETTPTGKKLRTDEV